MNSIFYAGMTMEEGFHSCSFYCCSPKVKAWLCFPNFLQPLLSCWVPLSATCHRASWASQAELFNLCSQDQVRVTLLTASHLLPFTGKLEPRKKPFGTWKEAPPMLVPFLWHQYLTGLPLPTFSFPFLENHILPYQGFQPLLPQK